MNPTDADRREARLGVVYGLACYLSWGFVPIYFKQIVIVPPLEILAHRIIWSVVFLSLVLTLRRAWPAIVAAVRSPRTMWALVASTALIACNWYTFIWAVSHNLVLQASLGYYINPLVSVLLGFIFLRERLRPMQWTAVALAACAVIYFTIQTGATPRIALFLAVSFALYGLLRKVAPVGALPGLAIETAFLLPIAVGFLLHWGNSGRLIFATHSRAIDLLLIAGGVVTAVPLWWFANAARRLRLSTMGIMQYIAPTLQLVLGAAVYGEPTQAAHWITFGGIWLALAYYTADALRQRARIQRSVRAASGSPA